jgi:hypothetical protein
MRDKPRYVPPVYIGGFSVPFVTTQDYDGKPMTTCPKCGRLRLNTPCEFCGWKPNPPRKPR